MRSELTPPVRAGPPARLVRSAVPALKPPPTPFLVTTAHARPTVGRGGTEDRARTPRLRQALMAGVTLVAALVRASGTRGSGAGLVQDLGMVDVAGGWAGQALAAAGFWFSDPQFQSQLEEVLPENTELRARAREW